MTGEECDGHGGLSAEARALARTVLDRIGPVLDRLRTEQATGAADSCSACPVCAVLGVLRGERPELAVRLAEQTAGLVAVLRAALDEGDPAAGRPPGAPPPGAPTAGDPPPSSRPVQRIHVERAPTAR